MQRKIETPSLIKSHSVVSVMKTVHWHQETRTFKEKANLFVFQKAECHFSDPRKISSPLLLPRADILEKMRVHLKVLTVISLKWSAALAFIRF